jgi:S-adenosylmethionine-diacylglycerol 3-amino-3-carboxypropyl transferase
VDETITAESSDWLDSAAKLPLAFAQVREDALQDLSIIERLSPRSRVMMIASGGCTAAALACTAKIDRLHLVDANASQLALCKLKLRLLQWHTDERAELLGHASMEGEARQNKLRVLLEGIDLDENAIGPIDLVARAGPDQAGRYEVLFDHLRQRLSPYRLALDDVLMQKNPNAQRRLVAPDTELGAAIDAAYDDVLSLPNLVRLFGLEATNNPVEPFSRHFARRTRHVLATQPAAENPYLWQMLAGRFPPGVYSPWLTMKPAGPLPGITFTRAAMTEALAAHREEFDYVHLSNILDWLAPQEAARTLRLTWQALRPGGWVMIRQLNSSLNIPAAGEQFAWQANDANTLHAADRSFFYRELHLGQKR